MARKTILRLSRLPKTWIIDIDGVIFPHNHYLDPAKAGTEKPLPGIKQLLDKVGEEDRVVIMTARKKRYASYTKRMLKKFGIRYDVLLTGMPHGERILINDIKTDGLRTAYGINVKRDDGVKGVKVYIGSRK